MRTSGSGALCKMHDYRTSRWLVVLVVALVLLLLANIAYTLLRTSRPAAQTTGQRPRYAGPVERVKNQEEERHIFAPARR